MIPAMFISHGSPYLAIEENDYTAFLNQLGAKYQPKAIVIFSAHWEAKVLSLTYTDGVLDTVYDYYGFPKEMYEVKYPAKGSTKVAELLEERFKKAGIQTQRETKRGLDHGSWVALKHMYPKADIPVIQLSVHPFLSVEEQINIGKALQGLDSEDIMVLGSGTTVHNLRWLFPEAKQPAKEAVAFDEWLIEKMTARDDKALEQYATLAPYAKLAVPRPEHFIPLFISYGSGNEKKAPQVIYRSYEMGTFSNLTFEF